MSVRPDGRTFEALALAEYESAWGLSTAATRRLAATLADRLQGGAPLEEVMLALACERLGMKEEAGRLSERAVKRTQADVPTAAFLLQLQAARGGEAGSALRFLLSRRAGQGWRTTIESAWAILGLSALLERPSAGGYAAPGRLAIRVNEEVVKEITLPDRADPSFDGRISVPGPPAGWGDKVVVRLSFDGKGTAFYTASLEGMLGGEDPAPVKRGLEVSREYYEKEGEGWKPVEGNIHAGRPVLVRLEIRSPAPYDYVMVTDPRPDGFEPLDREIPHAAGKRRIVRGLTDAVDLSDGWQARLDRFRVLVRGDAARESEWAHALLREILEKRRFAPRVREEAFELPGGAQAASIEHRDDRTLFFIGALPAGATHLYYVVRPEFPGRLHALPPQAAPMYDPEIYGSGAEARLEVTDEKLVDPSPGPAELAPGVAGLARVISRLGKVDADALIALVPSGPRIGELLMRVMTEPTLRAWLSGDSTLAAAGDDLRERIEAARRDLATRRLCAEALGGAPREWLPAIDEALASDALARRALEGAKVGEIAALDNVLLWVSEDRAFRLRLLAEAQRLRGTAHVDAAGFRPVTADRVLAALGPQAPRGDGLATWKLSQRGAFTEGTLRGLAARLQRDLALDVKIAGWADWNLPEAVGRLSEILDQVLPPANLFYRIRDGAVTVGALDDLLK